jgi:hypothetical protein
MQSGKKETNIECLSYLYTKSIFLIRKYYLYSVYKTTLIIFVKKNNYIDNFLQCIVLLLSLIRNKCQELSTNFILSYFKIINTYFRLEGAQISSLFIVFILTEVTFLCLMLVLSGKHMNLSEKASHAALHKMLIKVSA